MEWITRYEAWVEDGALYLESDEGPLEIGAFDDVVDAVGTETYTVEYDDREAAVSWLATDEDNTISFDVRETVLEIPYTSDFVKEIERCPPEEEREHDQLSRTELFADLITTIWDQKGNVQ